MARIVISLSGEGRGHAARTLTLLDMLRQDHSCLVLTPASIYAFMENATRHMTGVAIHPLPSLSFRYHENGSLSYWHSALAAAPFIWNRNQLINELMEHVSAYSPDLAIADFEPLLPRVAHRLGITLLSLDHQHFLHAMDMRILPTPLRLRAQYLRPSVKLFCPWANEHLVSSFFRYPQRPGTENCTQIGVLLRPELRDARPSYQDHLLVYVRRESAAHWLPILKKQSRQVRVYGTQRQGRDGNLCFRPISVRGFIDDLAGCQALVTTAGNQLVGEAMSLGKPVLTMPERGNFEQQLNGFFLNRSGCGLSLDGDMLSTQRLAAFLADAAGYREAIATHASDGNQAVKEAVHRLLPRREPHTRTHTSGKIHLPWAAAT